MILLLLFVIQQNTGIMDNKQEIRDQFYSYINGNADTDLIEGLFAYFETEQGRTHLSELVNETFDNGIDAAPELLSRVIPLTDRVGARLAAEVAPSAPRMIWRPYYTIIAIAAAILLAIATFIYLGNYRLANSITGQSIAMDVNPGTNRATLTLSDGRTIDLSTTANGNVVTQDGLKINKTAEGQIAYDGNGSASTNTVATPNGGQYQVRLPDGTKVWLNAASSISYATDLATSAKRVVQLSGEAYFEVAHDRTRPFIVASKEQQVQVHGTKFNVNGYGDRQGTITTLAEGSVEVFVARKSELLVPGQQSVLKGSSLKLQQADMETALAWKNGNIIFKSARLEEIMQQITRWYDIEVVYEGKIRDRVFTGGISRNSKLSVLLNILNNSGISAEIAERPQGKVLVLKP